MSNVHSSSTVLGTNLRNGQAFAEWARSYDTQLNPLLALEERYLKRMLPDIRGRDVLDAGCGSGRWLNHLASGEPRTLKGIDASEEMLGAARARSIPRAELYCGHCESTPFENNDFDLVLLSFVLGYIEGVESLAPEIDRIARDNCDLFISDMHPTTQKSLGWRRAFHGEMGEVVLDTATHNLQAIVAIFRALGWEVRAAMEPEFGVPEREIFAASNRLDKFLEAESHPAIYLLHLQKQSANAPLSSPKTMTICNARCAIGPRETAFASVRICKKEIDTIACETISPTAVKSANQILDLTGHLLLPGLVNAHDHLEFALFPRLAYPPYGNASEWAHDIQNRFADEIAFHCSVPLNVRLWWGGLRNLLCGVTTVCHHNPMTADLKNSDFPVRVAQRFGWGHSLRFGGDLRAASAATPADFPFIVHACEGIDDEARAELDELDRIGLLGSSSVLVHGLAIDNDGIALMERRKAALVLCPSSNDFLFDKIPDARLWSGARKVALASDSPLTAEGDLLDEIRFATRLCGFSADDAFRMTTEQAAVVLRLKNAEGTLRIGSVGDLIAVKDTHGDPAETLIKLSHEDVELVVIGGRVQLASDEMFARLPPAATKSMESLSIDGTLRWLRAPVAHLLHEAEKVLGVGRVRLGGKRVCAADVAEVVNEH